MTNRSQAIGQSFPFVPAQHDAEVRYRYVVPVHGVGVGLVLGRGLGVLVDHQLVAIEVEVDPVIAGATLGEAEDVAVEVPGGA